MNRTDIQSKIQTAAARFTDELVAVFGEAFAAVASDLTFQAPAGKSKGPAKKTSAKKAAPAKLPAAKPAAPGKPGKRIRRSGDQLVADGEKIVKLLAANKKGLRIEQINKQLGTATKQLARPILKLLADRKIRKTGERRATLYFPV